jgi:hypothetical protein
VSRDEAVARYQSALERLEHLDELLAGNSFRQGRIELHREYVLQDIDDAAAEYVAALPLRTVSRCPFTGATTLLAVDTVGLDGPWWNHAVPRRPLPVGLPPSLVGFDGALRLTGDLPVLPFVVGAGPQVPTVIPRVLEMDGIAAVVSTLRVGAFDAWLIAYYASDEVASRPFLDDWGTDQFLGVSEDGAVGRYSVGTEVRDPVLKPWLERGRLKWIAPGDETLTVRDGVAECPFVGLEGGPDPVWLVAGEVLEFDVPEGVPT